MNAVAPRGWCPSLLTPMPSGDGLLVRVTPPAGVLTATAARCLADAAANYGNGCIELTNRAGLQVRGLRPATVAPFASAMRAAGLGNPGPQLVVAPPLAGDDPGVSGHAGPVAGAVATLLARLPGLPAKFGCLVDGGGVLPLGGVPADILVGLGGVVGADAQSCPPLAGTGSHAIAGRCRVGIDGSDLGVEGDASAMADRVFAIALAFLRLAPACATPPRRMRALVAELGGAALFAAAGLPAVRIAPLQQPTLTVGWLPYGDGARGAFAAGLPFGATDAVTLTALAALSERLGDGTLRVTPWRAFALAGVTAPDRAREAVTAIGLIAAADDPRARVAACAGLPACASASVATRDAAAWLAALDLPGTLHVSGCAKGCARPRAADAVLVGEAGRYNLIRHGRAGDAPILRGLTLAEAAATLRRPGTGAPA